MIPVNYEAGLTSNIRLVWQSLCLLLTSPMFLGCTLLFYLVLFYKEVVCLIIICFSRRMRITWVFHVLQYFLASNFELLLIWPVFLRLDNWLNWIIFSQEGASDIYRCMKFNILSRNKLFKINFFRIRSLWNKSFVFNLVILGICMIVYTLGSVLVDGMEVVFSWYSDERRFLTIDFDVVNSWFRDWFHLFILIFEEWVIFAWCNDLVWVVHPLITTIIRNAAVSSNFNSALLLQILVVLNFSCFCKFLFTNI